MRKTIYVALGKIYFSYKWQNPNSEQLKQSCLVKVWGNWLNQKEKLLEPGDIYHSKEKTLKTGGH